MIDEVSKQAWYFGVWVSLILLALNGGIRGWAWQGAMDNGSVENA